MNIDATQDLIIYAPLITAIVAVIFNAFTWPNRAKGLVALVLGVGLAAMMLATSDAEFAPTLIQGIGAGLAATGVYETAGRVVKSASPIP